MTFTFGPHVLLHYETANPAYTAFTQPTFTFAGDTIVVTQHKLTQSPAPACLSADLDLGPLSAGRHQLAWEYVDFAVFNGFPFELVVNSGFDVPEQVPALDSRALAVLLIVLVTAGAWTLRR
jgi:hypothetical protein